jgi:hypothetical protein
LLLVSGNPKAVSIYFTAMATAFANEVFSIPSEGLAAQLMLQEDGKFNA